MHNYLVANICKKKNQSFIFFLKESSKRKRKKKVKKKKNKRGIQRVTGHKESSEPQGLLLQKSPKRSKQSFHEYSHQLLRAAKKPVKRNGSSPLVLLILHSFFILPHWSWHSHHDPLQHFFSHSPSSRYSCCFLYLIVCCPKLCLLAPCCFSWLKSIILLLIVF